MKILKNRSEIMKSLALRLICSQIILRLLRCSLISLPSSAVHLKRGQVYVIIVIWLVTSYIASKFLQTS